MGKKSDPMYSLWTGSRAYGCTPYGGPFVHTANSRRFVRFVNNSTFQDGKLKARERERGIIHGMHKRAAVVGKPYAILPVYREYIGSDFFPTPILLL